MKSTRRILAAVALAAALATSGAAVAQATSAAIQGKTDPEATVIIRKPDGTETPTRTVSLRVGQTARIQ